MVADIMSGKGKEPSLGWAAATQVASLPDIIPCTRSGVAANMTHPPRCGDDAVSGQRHAASSFGPLRAISPSDVYAAGRPYAARLSGDPGLDGRILVNCRWASKLGVPMSQLHYDAPTGVKASPRHLETAQLTACLVAIYTIPTNYSCEPSRNPDKTTLRLAGTSTQSRLVVLTRLPSVAIQSKVMGEPTFPPDEAREGNANVRLIAWCFMTRRAKLGN